MNIKEIKFDKQNSIHFYDSDKLNEQEYLGGTIIVILSIINTFSLFCKIISKYVRASSG